MFHHEFILLLLLFELTSLDDAAKKRTPLVAGRFMASITFVWFLLFVFVGTEAVQFHRAVIKTGPLDFRIS
jgi:hypothetical protein